MTTPASLIELGQGVFAFVDPTRSFGRSNVGLVIDADGLTLVDVTATPAQGAAVKDQILELTADLGLPIKRVVISSSRIPFSGGGDAFWSAAFYGTEATSDQLDAPSNPEAFRRLLPEMAGAYHDEFSTRPITHTVSEEAWLTPALQAWPVAGESAANLTAIAQGAGVVYAGAIASFGVTPLAFDANPWAWMEALDQLRKLDMTVVPGHGLPGGSADLQDQIDYLAACIEANGKPEALAPGPWDHWTDRRFDAVNVERAASLGRGIDEVPAAMYQLLGFA